MIIPNIERGPNFDTTYYSSTLEPNVEMSFSIHDQQRVFVAYRALFDGPNAQVRKSTAIQKVLTSGNIGKAKRKDGNPSSISLSPTVSSLGLSKVVAILKVLLERGIFASELKAKLAFPSLYMTSPEQDARHEASDAGAARTEAEAMQEAQKLNNIAAADKVADDTEPNKLGNPKPADHNQIANATGGMNDALLRQGVYLDIERHSVQA